MRPSRAPWLVGALLLAATAAAFASMYLDAVDQWHVRWPVPLSALFASAMLGHWSWLLTRYGR